MTAALGAWVAAGFVWYCLIVAEVTRRLKRRRVLRGLRRLEGGPA